MSSTPPPMLIVCRQASDPPTVSGCLRGRCHECGKPIWLTPKAQEQMLLYGGLGAKSYCNPCGFDLAKNLGGGLDVVLNPAAAVQFAKKP